MRRIVSNASPLISLARVSLLDFVKELFGEVIIPEEVFKEIVRKGKGKAGAKEIERASWIRSWKAEKRLINEYFDKYHGRGLTPSDIAVVVLAKQEKAEWVIADDYDLRKVLEEEHFKVTGTVGILLRAKEKKKISSVKEVLDKLIDKGFRVSNRLYNRALQKAGE